MRSLSCFLLAAAISIGAIGAEQNPDSHSILFNITYGELVPGSTPAVQLWWASSMWKICKCRPAPIEQGEAIQISAARNEWDAAQLVVRPSIPLNNFIAESTALTGPDGATLSADTVELLRVRYVNIQHKTDKWGALAPWPDPLPKFTAPINLDANPKTPNQPIWIRVHVPKDTPAGLYTGSIKLKADGYAAEAPLHLTVYDFELPDRMTCQSAFGFNPSTVYTYQKVSDSAQRREVLDKYWESFRDHHISPYNPTPMTPLNVEWVKLGENEGADLPEADRKLLQQHALTPKFDWAPWDAETERVFNTYHFNTLKLGLPAVWGGDLQGFAPGTREHDLAFTNYCRTMQEHLREKGWLDYAYVYGPDEPKKSQYESVKRGYLKLRAAAPDIQGMVTEQVVDGLAGGPAIWCPDSLWYVHEDAEQRRAEGDRFWWYVCTLPKAPFPGLFIDHPGTDFRVWLWQTWKYDIEGILIWHSNLWTTSRAYPNSQQNPYEDPMSWDSSPVIDRGAKTPWGNGDGRFIYPPEVAADANPPEPVLDGPVDSIRWEVLRDGIEDYEYFVILKRLLEERGDDLSKRKRKKIEKLLLVPDEITSSLKEYTKDPAPIEAHRQRVAEAIELLSAR